MPNGTNVRVVRTGHPDERPAQVPRRSIGIFCIILCCTAMFTQQTDKQNKNGQRFGSVISSRGSRMTLFGPTRVWHSYCTQPSSHPTRWRLLVPSPTSCSLCRRHSAVVVSRARFVAVLSAAAYFFLLSIRELFIFIQSSSFMTLMTSRHRRLRI